MATDLDLERFAIVFGADNADLKKGLDNANKLVKDFAGNAKKLLAPLLTYFAGKRLFSEFLQADELGKFAAQFGENIQDIDAWGEAVRHAGGSAEGLRGSIATLNRGLTQVSKTGQGRAKKALDALGISATDAQGNIRKTTDVLLDLANKADTIDSREFAGLAATLGLDQGTIRLLQQGNKSVKEQIALLRERAFTERDAKVASDFKDAQQDLYKALQSVANLVLRQVTPVITVLIRGLTWFFDLVRDNKIVTLGFFSLLAATIGVKLVSGIAVAIKALKALGFALRLNPLGLLITLITGLLLLIDDLIVYLNGGEAAFGSFWDKILGGVRVVKRAFSDFGDYVSDLFASLIGKVREVLSLLPDSVLPPSLRVIKAGVEYADDRLGPIESVPTIGGSLLGSADSGPSIASIRIDEITIETQATDAQGIANDIGSAVDDSFSRELSLQSAGSVRY